MSALDMNITNSGSSIFSFQYHDSGVSEEANSISGQLREIKSNIIQEESISLGKSYLDLHSELEQILDEASSQNWDGYGAKPAIRKSYLEAQRFIDCYSPSLPLPEASIDPDGEFSFEWYKDANHIFSISFSADSFLTYAGVFGINKSNGKEYFEDEIPQIIIQHIKRVYSGF